ncbi:uncharacterized protein LOC100878941 isoform X2 [Megachile rotundata]|uniref:uncharacterized protein LOC100878941 isoform X2 n=1 Tax=Megachile rotundata TaxID=143995 RepID=UPI000258F921|nr:PREDICTED: myb-like protein X isoform X1 [Megachile rotundata]XP_012151652.1 PREDICTED: myb-like protein X isoform X1 [Megachile rotundata]
MPKENKSTSRRNRRQCSEVDNETAGSSARDSSKSAINGNRYNPFVREIPRTDSKTKQENTMMPSIEVLHSMSGGIIESGIKYILFPLHLLRFCIFGTSTKSIDSDKLTESSSKKDTAEKEEKKTKEREEKKHTQHETSRVKPSEKSRQPKLDHDLVDENKDAIPDVKTSKEKKNNDKDESADEMVTAEEDSDSSGEQWSTANDIMEMNISVDNDNLDKISSNTVLEEPMDISIEEQSIDKMHIPRDLSRDHRIFEQFQNNKENIAANLNVNDQDSNSSVDEEIARIFQKQCTSSEDEFPSSFVKSSSSFKREKMKQNNFLYYKTNYNASTVAKREAQSNTREQKKKEPSDFSINSKRRKVSNEENKHERHSERKTGNKIREEKRSSRQNTPSKHESRSSRTTVKNRETKRKDVKFKEIATQTDSAFSDDDVEMIPVDGKLYEKQLCHKRTGRRLQFNLLDNKNTEQELNYIADNEDSNDGSSKVERKRISSSSTSSSSTDLGFDERAMLTPDMLIVVGRSRTNSLDNTNNFPARSRPPPGFPELPQNPPLMSYVGNNYKHFLATHSKYNCLHCSIVPPAPSPMRHLYYDYPEFMDLPIDVNSSKILNNILRNNYYR